MRIADINIYISHQNSICLFYFLCQSILNNFFYNNYLILTSYIINLRLKIFNIFLIFKNIFFLNLILNRNMKRKS